MGKPILVSSHILHELAQVCTRIGIIEAGRMVAEGSLEDIYRQLDLRRIIHVRAGNSSDALIEAIRAIPGVDSVERQIDRLAIEIDEQTISCEDLLDRLQGL